MAVKCPPHARAAARVVMIDDQDRVLYLHARGASDQAFWVMPGGGLEAGESFEEAAVRETYEETGISVSLGPCLWTRHHVFDNWLGKHDGQFEVFFLARIPPNAHIGGTPDDYVHGHRWWSLQELERSVEVFAPRRIARLIAPVLRGEYPSEPFECGV